MKVRGIKTLTGVAAVALAMIGTPAFADTISIVQDDAHAVYGVGQFDGTVDYSFDGLVGHLVMSLTNTTDDAIGGWITAVAFDTKYDVTLSDYATDSGLVNALTDVHAPPFNTIASYYDQGASIGTDWLTTGLTSQGIDNGETGTFSWTVSGTDAATMTAMDFVDAGKKAFGFVVRFRGFNLDMVENGHDKVPAQAAAVVPLPAPVALGAFGLVGAALGSRRMRRKTSKN